MRALDANLPPLIHLPTRPKPSRHAHHSTRAPDRSMALSSAASASLTPLPDDIQRALQQAVGDANNAANAAAVQAKAKKSKRQRDETGEEGVAEWHGSSVGPRVTCGPAKGPALSV